jgi:hypothetical protein
MRFAYVLVISGALFFCAGSCEDDIVDVPPVAPDTTSHDFTWDLIIFEAAETGRLNDICYINDTCIWAVGWFICRGPQGERLLYNAIRWNGVEWRMEQVFESIPGSSAEQSLSELSTVYGDRPDNVWFNTGSIFIHWDGRRFTTDAGLMYELDCFLTECWADGPDNIWMGGTDGELVRYDGKRWKRINNDIPDEWDIRGMHGNGDTLLLAATQYGSTGWTAFYHVIGETVRFWRQDSVPQGVQAVWFDHLNNVYTDGGRVYHWNGEKWNNLQAPGSGGYGYDMAAISRFDILSCGAFGTIRHYNGKTWRSWWKFPGTGTPRLVAIARTENEAWICGSGANGGKAIMIHGKR